MRMKNRIGRLQATLLLMAVALVGCGLEVPEAESGKLGGAASDLSLPNNLTVTSWTPSPDQCSNFLYRTPLTVSTSVDAERSYMNNVVACTTYQPGGPIWLHNIGNEIWRVASNGGALSFLDYTPASDVFAAAFDFPSILVPGDVLLVSNSAGRVSWTLDKAYTIAWETQLEGIDQLKQYGEGAAYLAVKRKGTQAQAALTACTLSAFDAADTWSNDPNGFNENFGAALTSSAGGASCASKWKSTWDKKFKPTTQFLDDADNSFRVFSRFGRGIRIILSS
jgi:hypothetical protein